MSDNNGDQEVKKTGPQHPAPVPGQIKKFRRPTALTVKARKFVKRLAQTGVVGQSVLDAGYKPKNAQNTSLIGSQLLAKPAIQEALSVVLDNMFPNRKEEQGKWIQKALSAPIKGSLQDTGELPPMTWKEKMAAIEMLSKIDGSFAASKKTVLTANAKDYFRPPK